MTDREKLLSICESLGLERTDDPDAPADSHHGGGRKYYADDERVVIGSGRLGYGGFFARFRFGPDGSAVGHEVAE